MSSPKRPIKTKAAADSPATTPKRARLTASTTAAAAASTPVSKLSASKSITPSSAKQQPTSQTKSKKPLAEFRAGAHVPHAIYKTVLYQAEDEEDDPEAPPRPFRDNKARVAAWTREHFDVPANFDTNKKYGALSGLHADDRLIAAMENGLFEPRTAQTKASSKPNVSAQRDD